MLGRLQEFELYTLVTFSFLFSGTNENEFHFKKGNNEGPLVGETQVVHTLVTFRVRMYNKFEEFVICGQAL